MAPFSRFDLHTFLCDRLATFSRHLFVHPLLRGIRRQSHTRRGTNRNSFAISAEIELLERRIQLSALTFTSKTVVGTGQPSVPADGASAVFAGDIDGDGDLDLLSSSYGDDRNAWYENTTGDGSTFIVHTIDSTADGAVSVSAADLDGDGDLDVLAASWNNDALTWYENDGTASPTFTKHTVTTTADAPRSIVAADIDGDGDLDLLAAAFANDTIVWYENTRGNASEFVEHLISDAADGAFSVHAADLDGDGDVDVLSASRRDNSIRWFENSTGDGTAFLPHTISSTALFANSVFTADIDGDGDLDVLSASRDDNTIAWHENTAGDATEFLAHTITSTASGAFAVTAADLDNDGDIDVISASHADNRLLWFENTTGTGTIFTTHLISSAALAPQSVVARDIDGDGYLDVISAAWDNDQIAWHHNNGPQSTNPVADILDVTPDPRATHAGPVTITFSREISGIDVNDFRLTRDGNAISLSGITLVQVSPARYTLDLTSVTADAGNYQLTLLANTSGIADTAGNPLLDNAVDQWITDTQAPSAQIGAVSPNPRQTPAGIIPITFSENVSCVDIADFSLTRDGNPVSLAGLSITQTSAANYSLNLGTLTSQEGTYALKITALDSGIKDQAGNGLLIDATTSWTVDTTSPTADVIDITPDPLSSNVGNVTVTFSEDVTGVDIADFQLTLDTTNIPLSGITVVRISATEYQLDLQSVTTGEGTFRLQLIANGSGIADPAGNTLSADADDEWIIDRTPSPPALMAPGAFTVDATPTFEIGTMPHAALYDLWVNNQTTGQVGVIRQKALKTTTHTPTTPLPTGQTYIWTARSISADGIPGEWSAHQTFTILNPPTLQQPQSATTEIRPKFTWSEVLNISRYDVWVNDLTTGQSGIIRNTNVTQTSFEPAVDLPIGHDFLWTVRAIDDSGNSGEWAAHQQFRTMPPLAPPEITAPANPANTLTPEFRWTAVTGAVRYDVWVNDQTTASNSVIRNQTIAASSFVPTIPLTDKHQYIWTVRAIDAAGMTSEWASHQTFTVDLDTPEHSTTPPARTTLSTPQDTIAPQNPTFTWANVAGADHYELWVNDQTTGQVGVIRESSLTTNQYQTAIPLVTGHDYIWTVRAISHAGGPGEWAEHRTFHIAVPPAIPSLTTPKGTSASATPTFTWQAVSAADRYDLWVNDQTAGTSGVIRNQQLTTNSYTPATPLIPGHTYVWTVRTLSTIGSQSAWAQHQQFTVAAAPDAPAAITPIGNTGPTQPIFTWQTVNSAHHYDLWVNDMTTGQVGVIRERSLATSSYTSTTPLTAGRTYIWTVRAVNSADTEGEWATHQTFTITQPPVPPQLTDPKGTVTPSRPTFNWQAVEGADHYDLWVNDQTTGQSQVIRQTSLMDTTFTPDTSLAAGHSYIWTVRAISSIGSVSDWAPHATFSTATIPAAPQIIAPIQGATNATPLLEWTSSAETDRYDLWVKDQTTGQLTIIRNQDLTTNRYVPSAGTLTPGHTYIWTVRGINRFGIPGDWATHQTFTVATSPP